MLDQRGREDAYGGDAETFLVDSPELGSQSPVDLADLDMEEVEEDGSGGSTRLGVVRTADARRASVDMMIQLYTATF